MPAKKRGSKSPGGKKRRSTSRRRGSSKPKPIVQLDESERAVPLSSSIRHQAITGAVISSDIPSLSRMVTHYRYDKVLNAVDFNGSNSLHLACRKGDFAMSEKLLSYSKIDINSLEKLSAGGYSALHHACALGSTQIVELLLNYGADIHLKSNSAMGERPLHICCKKGNIACAEELINSGVQCDLRDNFGHNASYWAAQMGHDDMITKLNLPQSKAATAQEYLAIMMEKNKSYVLPSLAKKIIRKSGKKNSKSKSKSRSRSKSAKAKK